MALKNGIKLHLLVAAYFLLLVTAFFAPALFQGLTLFPHDAQKYYFAYKNLAAVETSLYHAVCYWNPFIFGGHPTLGDSQAAFFYPSGLLFLLFPNTIAMDLTLILHLSLAGFFTFLYCRKIKASAFGAVFAGTTYALSGFILGRLSFVMYVEALAWVPLVFYLIECIRASSSWNTVGLGSLVLCVFFLAGAHQLYLYTMLLCITYIIFLAAGTPAGRPLTVLLTRSAIFFFLGFLLCVFNILPIMEMIRSQQLRQHIEYSYFTAFSLPPRQLLCLVFPFAFGPLAGNELFPGLFPAGDTNFLETAFYTGMIPLWLALAGLGLAKKNRYALFWFVMAVISVFLGLGRYNPFTRLIYLVPVLNWFRAPARWLFILSFGTAVLSGLSLTGWNKKNWVLGAVLIVPLVLSGCLAVWSGWIPGFKASSPAFWLPLCFLAAGALTLYLFTAKQSLWLKIALLLLTILDLAIFGEFYGWRSLCQNHLPLASQLRQTLENIDGNTYSLGRYRIFNPNWPQAVSDNFGMLCQMESLTGFNPTVLNRFNRLETYIPSGIPDDLGYLENPDAISLLAAPHTFDLLDSPKILDLLNCKYLVIRPEDHPYACQGMVFHDDRQPVMLFSKRPELSLSFAPVSASRLGLISTMLLSFNVPDKKPVARVVLMTETGHKIQKILLAGQDTAEWAYDQPQNRSIQHRQAPMAVGFNPSPSGGCHYFSSFAWASQQKITRVVITLLDPNIILRVEAAALWDGITKISTPLSLKFTDESQWAFRGKCQDADIYQNLRVLPRFWLVRQTQLCTEEQSFQAVTEGVLPDSQPFDPLDIALVEQTSLIFRFKPDPAATLKVLDYDPDRIILNFSSTQPAILVASEMFYPGWSAYVDANKANFIQVDYLLRGLLVPPGSHEISLDYVPSSLYKGLVISGAGLLVLLAGLLFGRTKRN